MQRVGVQLLVKIQRPVCKGAKQNGKILVKIQRPVCSGLVVLMQNAIVLGIILVLY